MPNADVFISYRRDEREQVSLLASKLQELGLTVWFDARLEAGTSFDEEINREVRTARCVLVCWTPEAVQSRWVRAEASIGLERDVLAAIFLKPTQLVPPYNLVHASNLEGWAGAQDDPLWRDVLVRIGKLVGRLTLADEAAAKPLDAEWAERDAVERATYQQKAEDARRRFSAGHEARPAAFDQSLRDLSAAFESWILRRRTQSLGPAPDPLTLVTDHNEHLRLDLATAQRERDAAAALVARGQRSLSAANDTPTASSGAGPTSGKGRAMLAALGVLVAGPLALIALNKRILAATAVVLLIGGALLFQFGRGAPYDSSEPDLMQLPYSNSICFSAAWHGWFRNPGDARSYKAPPAAAFVLSTGPEISAAPQIEAQTNALVMYPTRADAEAAAHLDDYSKKQGVVAVSAGDTPELIKWRQDTFDTCEYRDQVSLVEAKAGYKSALNEYYEKRDSSVALLLFIACVFAISALIVLVQGLVSGRKAAREPGDL